MCPHRFHPLLSEPTNEHTVTCPYHRWNFSLAHGVLMKTPPFVQPKSKRQCNLMRGPLRKDIVLNLYHLLGYELELPRVALTGEDFVLAKTEDVHVNANWKLAMINFLDVCHVPSIHKSLRKTSKVDCHNYQPAQKNHIQFSTTLVENKSVPFSETQEMVFDVVFPNFFAFTLPGHHAFCVSVSPHPHDPGKSTEHASLLVANETTNVNELWEFYNDTNKEDIVVIENIQRAANMLPADADARMCAITSEHDTPGIQFQEMYQDAMAPACLR